MICDIDINDPVLKSYEAVREFGRAKEIIKHTSEAISYFKNKDQTNIDLDKTPGGVTLLQYNTHVANLGWPRKLSGNLVFNPKTDELLTFSAEIETEGISHKIREFDYTNDTDKEYYYLTVKDLETNSNNKETVIVNKNKHTLSYFRE
jgi:hypothetical protein